MRLFQPEVEVVLKMLGAIVLVSLVALPVAWGYEQRQQAETWRAVACTYRIKELQRQAPMFNTMRRAADPCGALRRLGLDLETSR
jgi:hypothetical protein